MSKIPLASTKIPIRHIDNQSDPEGHKRPGRDKLGARNPPPTRVEESRTCGAIDPEYRADEMQAARDRSAPPSDPIASLKDPKGLKRSKTHGGIAADVAE